MRNEIPKNTIAIAFDLADSKRARADASYVRCYWRGSEHGSKRARRVGTGTARQALSPASRHEGQPSRVEDCVSGEIATLPRPSGVVRDHITLSIEELAQRLADAEEVGARRVWNDCAIDVRQRWLLTMERTRRLRANLYAAQFRALLR